jgi:hypothetical protein
VLRYLGANGWIDPRRPAANPATKPASV